jgi:hypothetical protein
MAKQSSGKKIQWFDTVRSPKGVAGFNYLVEPDTKYGAKHRIELFILDAKDPEFKAFAAKLVETKKAYLTSVGAKDDGKVPGLKKADAYHAEKFGAHGVKEGTLYFEFSSLARLVEGTTDEYIPVSLYNAKGEETSDVRVFSGDIIRVSVRLGGYNTGKEKGIKPYLQAVQMIVKKNGGGGNVNVFTDESGEEPAADAVDTAAPFDAEGDEAQVPAEKPAAKSTKAKAAAAPAADDVDLADLV